MSTPSDLVTARLTVRAIGVLVPVVLEDVPVTFVEAFERAWHLCLVDAPREGLGGAPLAEPVVADATDGGTSTSDWRSELTGLTQRVTQAAIAAQAGRVLMFHAGALSHPETGASIVFVAPGGTGKTTLARTLGPRWAYLTDETVAVADGGEILPYPKPLSVRTNVPGAKEEFAPGDLGLRAVSVQPWVAGIVTLHRVDYRSTDEMTSTRALPHCEAVELLDAIVELTPETSSLARLSKPLARLDQLLGETGGLTRVTYREANSLHAIVETVLGRSR